MWTLIIVNLQRIFNILKWTQYKAQPITITPIRLPIPQSRPPPRWILAEDLVSWRRGIRAFLIKIIHHHRLKTFLKLTLLVISRSIRIRYCIISSKLSPTSLLLLIMSLNNSSSTNTLKIRCLLPEMQVINLNMLLQEVRVTTEGREGSIYQANSSK
jgi:hypothetical protein